MNESSPSNYLSRIILKTIGSSTIHGLPKIINNRSNIIKFMWLICFIASTCVCFWFLSITIDEYLKFESVTKIETIFTNQLTFPIVSICNLKYLHSNQMIKTNETIYDTLIECRFSMENCSIENDIEIYTDINYGKCFRFNSIRSSKHSYRRGMQGGLELLLFTDSSDYENNYSNENGFNLFLTNEPLSSNSITGFKLSPGNSIYISLDKQTINLKEKPYSNCIQDLNQPDSYKSDVFKKTLISNKQFEIYHFKNCYYVCMQKYLLDNCGCQFNGYDFVYSPRNNTSLFCTNQEQMNCLNKKRSIFNRNKQYLEQCDCPLECQTIEYKFLLTYSKYPTNFSAQFLYNHNDLIKKKIIKSNMDTNKLDFLRGRLVKLFIYYDDMKETIINHEAKFKLADFVSSIGGTLGLFLGISFLSFIELIEILIELIFILIK